MMRNEILMTQIDDYVFGAIAVIGAAILFFMIRECYNKYEFKNKLAKNYKSSHK